MASADHEAALRSRGVDADALNNKQQIVVTAEEDMMLRQVSVNPSLANSSLKKTHHCPTFSVVE
jgi:hypothetical protein